MFDISLELGVVIILLLISNDFRSIYNVKRIDFIKQIKIEK